MDKKEEKVLVIGNGFDLYHYLPTRYIDFIRTVNRLIELENRSNLENCRYIRYLWGPDSPLYQQDVFIQKCYKNHTDKMRSVELKKEKLQELVDIAKKNTWIKYFQACLDKNVGWIDFEKEIGNVLLAVQELFSLDNRVQDLILGILISTNSSIDLKTYDILEHMPFVEETENTLVLKKEYCKKSIGNEYYVSINKEMILEQLEDDLEKLARALCIYLKEFVQKIAIDKAADNTVFYGVDKIINFNYTDTYRRLYGAKVDVKFIHGSIDNEENGVFYPQNREYVKTSDMVKMIADVKGHNIIMLPGLGWLVKLMMKFPGQIGELARKAFGDLAYDVSLSRYKEEYCIVDLQESIRTTEG